MSPGSDLIAGNDSGCGVTGENGVGSSLTAGSGGGNDSAGGSDYFWQKKGH